MPIFDLDVGREVLEASQIAGLTGATLVMVSHDATLAPRFGRSVMPLDGP